MLYALATLDVQLWAVPKTLPALESYTSATPGRLLGCRETDIGEIGGRLPCCAAYERGVWPPRNGPASIARATSTIAVPTRISPLR